MHYVQDILCCIRVGFVKVDISVYSLVIFILGQIFQNEILKSPTFSEYYNIIVFSTSEFGSKFEWIYGKKNGSALSYPSQAKHPDSQQKYFHERKWKILWDLRFSVFWNVQNLLLRRKCICGFFTHSIFMFWVYEQECPICNKKDSQIFFKLHVLH